MAKILVIEDEQHLRATLHDLLYLEGYEVQLAPDGKEGVAKVFQVQPDLIVCDVMMPEMSGYEVLTTLRASHSAVATVPFIFLTAKAEREDHRLGMELGADDYIAKPFDKHEVFRAIKTQLDRRQKMQEAITAQLNSLQSSTTIALNHEYLTPMTNIKSGLELLNMYGENLSVDQIKEIVSTSLSATVRLERLIHNLLLFQKIHAGLSLKEEWLEPIDIVSLTNKIIYKVNRQNERANVRVDCAEAVVHSDKEYLMTALYEILDNAYKFSDPQTSIEITGSIQDDKYCLRITDQGRGMLPNEIDQIGAFKQFERDRFEQQGVGLGLFLARELARISFAKMSIASTPGEGTVVEFMLPLYQR